jgi:hypothetical protein
VEYPRFSSLVEKKPGFSDTQEFLNNAELGFLVSTLKGQRAESRGQKRKRERRKDLC